MVWCTSEMHKCAPEWFDMVPYNLGYQGHLYFKVVKLDKILPEFRLEFVED